MKISTQLATGSVYNGGSGQSELDIQGSDNGDQVTINGGGLTIDGVHVNYRTGNTASGSTTITGLASASLLTVGQTVTGGGLPSGTTIISIDPNTNNIVVSNPASVPGAGVGVTLTFGISFKSCR